jgi:hypothetical protein
MLISPLSCPSSVELSYKEGHRYLPVCLLGKAFSSGKLLQSSEHHEHDMRRPARKLAVRASPGEAAFIDYLPGLGNRPQVLPTTGYIKLEPEANS